MKTIEAHVPEPVLKLAEQLAMREHLPLEQVITLAVTQGVGAWSSESDFQAEIAIRAKRANREKFLDALTAALQGESNQPKPLPLPRWYA